LGQFHLQRSLARLGMARENIQNESGSIYNQGALPDMPFEFALVPRRKFGIKNHQLGRSFLYEPH
jgi:hypothetical protein